MTRFLASLLLLLSLTCAAAQQRLNYLAVNGALVDAAGPYYFIEHGDNSNAFARAAPLAEAMGLTVTYLSTERALRFSDGVRTATFKATTDVGAGLVKKAGVVTLHPPLAGNSSLASPQAIIVDGVSYVAITPLVTAFEGVSSWNSERQVVTVDTVDRLAYPLAAPRTGITDGVSRVAIDIPSGAAFDVAANGNTLVVAFAGARANAVRLDLDDPNLTSVTLGEAAGQVNLVVKTRHSLDAAGFGFKVGEVDKGDSRTLYVDFGPTVTGTAVTALATSAPTPAVDDAPMALAAVPEQRQVVVIDAGHGGHDGGAHSSHATEKRVVLSVALKLKQLLERQGVTVVLTRDDDTFLTLQERSLFSTTERNLFISIHANAASNSSASGIETWVFGEPLNPSLLDRAIEENGGGAEGQALTEAARQAANDLATSILREAQLNYSLSLAQTVQRHMVSATGAKDRGVRANLFYVIRTARIPAVLVEIGFVSNPEEGQKLATDSYQQKLAEALADGVLEFLGGGGLLAQY